MFMVRYNLSCIKEIIKKRLSKNFKMADKIVVKMAANIQN